MNQGEEKKDHLCHLMSSGQIRHQNCTARNPLFRTFGSLASLAPRSSLRQPRALRARSPRAAPAGRHGSQHSARGVFASAGASSWSLPSPVNHRFYPPNLPFPPNHRLDRGSDGPNESKRVQTSRFRKPRQWTVWGLMMPDEESAVVVPCTRGFSFDRCF